MQIYKKKIKITNIPDKVFQIYVCDLIKMQCAGDEHSMIKECLISIKNKNYRILRKTQHTIKLQLNYPPLIYTAMKKLFTSIVALSFVIAGFNAAAETASPDASPEAKPAATSVEAPAPAQVVKATSNVIIPEQIAEHLALRFPGETVYGITREGVTYVVDLGDGLHIRYDNCFNPVCYGIHDHDSKH